MVAKPFDWRFVTDTELADMASQFTASQIGEKLGVSRNAVIGRCSRRGINLCAQAAHSYVRPVAVVKRPMVRHAIAPKLVKLASVEPVVVVPYLSIGITLMDLSADTCRWPLWRADTAPSDKRYCGAVTAEGSVYCAHCSALSYQPRRTDSLDKELGIFKFRRAA